MSQLPTSSSSNQSSTTLVIVAVCLAVFAVVVTNLYIANVRKRVEIASFEAFLLESEVRAGDTLSRNSYRVVKLPDTFESQFRDMGVLDRSSLEVAITTREQVQRPAREGALITRDLFTRRETAQLANQIRPGMRWTDIPINSRTAPGALAPGMYVDIEGTFIRPGGGQVVLPVMERVQVIALGERTAYDEEGVGGRSRSFRTMTIEVTPDEATTLGMVERIVMGEFQLHLRNPADDTLVKIPAGGINPAVIELIRQRTGQPVERRR